MFILIFILFYVIFFLVLLFSFIFYFLFQIQIYTSICFQIFQMYQLKPRGEYKPYYFNITNLSFYSPCYLFHGMYKWFPLKEKSFPHHFLIS